MDLLKILMSLFEIPEQEKTAIFEKIKKQGKKGPLGKLM